MFPKIFLFSKSHEMFWREKLRHPFCCCQSLPRFCSVLLRGFFITLIISGHYCFRIRRLKVWKIFLGKKLQVTVIVIHLTRIWTSIIGLKTSCVTFLDVFSSVNHHPSQKPLLTLEPFLNNQTIKSRSRECWPRVFTRFYSHYTIIWSIGYQFWIAPVFFSFSPICLKICM